MDPLKAIRMATMIAKNVGSAAVKPLMKSGGGSLSADDRHANLKKFMEGAHPEMFDELGNPRQFYHGTGKDFYKFQSTIKKPLHFVSPNPRFAARYALKEHLNPFESIRPEIMDDFVKELGSNWNPNVMPVHVNVKNPFDYKNNNQIGRAHV